MATFTGTDASESITPTSISSTVVRDPAGVFPGVGADQLYGNGGDDTLDGAGGNDSLDGGSGNDVLYGGTGQDTLSGGLGADTMVGGSSSDRYYVDDVGDTIVENADEGTGDTVYSSISYTLGADSNIENLLVSVVGDLTANGNDLDNRISSVYVNGGYASFTLNGFGGNDYLIGSGQLNGGDGNDFLQANGDAYMSGGSGDDVFYSDYGGTTLTMDGGTGDDTYYYNEGCALVEYADGGTDFVFAEYVNFTLGAEFENAEIDSGVGYGNEKNNDLSGIGSALYGFGGNDTLTGYYEDVALSGGEGDDSLIGDEGNDTLAGGLGTDWMSGDKGNDTYYVDSSTDIVIESLSGSEGGIDIVNTRVSFTLGENVENATLTGTASDGTGNDLNNVIVGNSVANILRGLVGNDTLSGGGGNDTLYGGPGVGIDRMSGDGGNDTYYIDDTTDLVIETLTGSVGGTDTVYARASFTLGDNLESLRMISGSNAVNATGNALSNELVGTASANTLRGLAGIDTLDSGGGADVLIGGAGADVFKFSSVAGSNPAERDSILAGDGAIAFESAGSAAGDRFDLRTLDANTGLAGVQHFTFGTATGVARLWAVNSGTDTLIRGNVDGDATVEFEVVLQDGSVAASAYAAADFLLA